MTPTQDDSDGVLVAIEGCDGSGKSTITPLVVEILRARGHTVRSLHPKSPNLSSPASHASAHLERLHGLLWGETVSDEGRNELPDAHWIALSGSWFAAIDELAVRPALKQGGLVVLDSWYTKLEVRFSLKGPALARHAANVYQPITRPHIGVLLDVDPAIAAGRKAVFSYSECGHFDGLRGRTRANFISYQSRVRTALVQRAETDGWAVVSTHAPPAAVADQVAAAIEVMLTRFPAL